MGLELVTFISDLNPNNPVGATDQKSQGDDHIRNIKLAILNTFPAITGAVAASQAEINLLDGLVGRTGTANLVASDAPTLINALLTTPTLNGATLNGATLNAPTLAGVVTFPPASIADAALSANVALRNAANVFTAANTFGATAFAGTNRFLFADAVYGLKIQTASALLRVGFSAGMQLAATDPTESGFAPLNIQASPLTFNGVSVADFARLSQNAVFGGGAKNEFAVPPNLGAAAAGSVVLGLRNETDDVEAYLGPFSASIGVVFSVMTNHALSVRTNNVDRFTISAGGALDFKSGIVTTANANAAEVGYKGIPLADQVGNYTFVANDTGAGRVYRDVGGHTFTVNNALHPPGTVLHIINSQAGNLTIAVTGATLTRAGFTGAGSTGNRTLATHGVVRLVKTATDGWFITGDGVSLS